MSENQEVETINESGLIPQNIRPLSKKDLAQVALAIHKMCLAHSIALPQGAVEVWIECLEEDINNNQVYLESFLKALNRMIREETYGKLSYSKALSIARHCFDRPLDEWEVRANEVQQELRKKGFKV